MKTLFMQVYANWRNDIINNKQPKIYTLGFAFHAKDIVEGGEDEYAIKKTTKEFQSGLMKILLINKI